MPLSDQQKAGYAARLSGRLQASPEGEAPGFFRESLEEARGINAQNLFRRPQQIVFGRGVNEDLPPGQTCGQAMWHQPRRLRGGR